MTEKKQQIIYRPESCLIVPKTLLPVSICCLGYRSETKSWEKRFHISTAPTKQEFSDETFYRDDYFPHCVRHVKSSYLQWSDCEAAHVVPEDQSAMWPGGGDDGGVEVSGLTIATVWTVCAHIPTLWTAPIRQQDQNKNIIMLPTCESSISWEFASLSGHCTWNTAAQRKAWW